MSKQLEPLPIAEWATVKVTRAVQVDWETSDHKMATIRANHPKLNLKSLFWNTDRAKLIEISYKPRYKDSFTVLVREFVLPEYTSRNDFKEFDTITLFYKWDAVAFLYNHDTNMLYSCYDYYRFGFVPERGPFPMRTSNKLTARMAATIALMQRQGQFLEYDPASSKNERALRRDGLPIMAPYKSWLTFQNTLSGCARIGCWGLMGLFCFLLLVGLLLLLAHLWRG